MNNGKLYILVIVFLGHTRYNKRQLYLPVFDIASTGSPGRTGEQIRRDQY